jgi:hypothetical protein
MTELTQSKPKPTPVEITQPLFSEAPAVVFTQLYGAKQNQIIQFNLTCRANTGEEAMEMIFRAIQYAAQYSLSTVKPDISQPAPAPSQSAPVPANHNSQTPQQPLPADGFAPGSGLIRAVKLEIVPEMDDKVTLKFYETGHQYPDITTKRVTERALELLQSTGDGWRIEDLQRASTRNIRYGIRYRESDKRNSRGNPYKDIVDIRPML